MISLLSDYDVRLWSGYYLDQYFRYVSPTKILITCMVVIMILNVMIARLIHERQK